MTTPIHTQDPDGARRSSRRVTTSTPAGAAVFVQCPATPTATRVPRRGRRPACNCMHLTAGDGFITMADGTVLYTFGFSDVTGRAGRRAMVMDSLGRELPGADHRARRRARAST